ncbi:MAG: nuclear transport factor 2 family protein [Leptolyngbya sp. SIOISBB]|nr:nuclear transport factor 2 family protein [Leptolyngbya sp. SIOISBB]
MNPVEFATQLYNSVDARSVADLAHFLADDVSFRFANAQPLKGKDAVLAANASFFQSIADMSHQIDQVWGAGDDLICNGQVNYTRLDGSQFSVPFATILKLQCDRIVNYLIYADVSAL